MTPQHENAFEWLDKAKRDLDGAAVMRRVRYYDARIESSFALLAAKATYLNPFAVLSRYPGNLGQITVKVSALALKYASDIYQHVIAVIPHKPKVKNQKAPTKKRKT